MKKGANLQAFFYVNNILAHVIFLFRAYWKQPDFFPLQVEDVSTTVQHNDGEIVNAPGIWARRNMLPLNTRILQTDKGKEIQCLPIQSGAIKTFFMKPIIMVVFFMVTISAIGQKAVVLQHNGITTVFSTTNPLADAYAASVSGDTIYLPGGVFPGLAINRRLTIFGTGHYPDSTLVTGVSQVASIEFQAGSDKSSIQGLLVSGGITFQSNIRIDSVVIARCNAGLLYLNGENNAATNCQGILIYQNVIGDMVLIHSSGVRVFNNIISSLHEMGTNSWIRNNKINGLYNCYYSLLENNTIASYSSGIDFNTFRNNILPVQPATGNGTWLNNFYNVDFSNLFVKQTAWFAYGDDYHLKTPANYPGTDALQAGIYGGYYPYKPGAVPANPHIQSSTIPLQTNTGGQLNIQVKVAAQNN